MGSLEREGSQRGRKEQKRKEKKKPKAAFLGGKTKKKRHKLYNICKTKPIQLSLGKVLAALRRKNYLHLLVARCRWWYSGEDYKQIVGILQFYCCVIASRTRYMTAHWAQMAVIRHRSWKYPRRQQHCQDQAAVPALGPRRAAMHAGLGSHSVMRTLGSVAQTRKDLSFSWASTKICAVSCC